jgi:hypothetical protein
MTKIEIQRSRSALKRAALISAVLVGVVLAVAAGSQAEPYSLTNLGLPTGATSAIGVRMNNAGDVAGWSAFSTAPFLRGWVWTEAGGFTVLPPPPGFTRYRAMDINDDGTVGGDGGFDGGLAWRYQDGVYTIIGSVEGLPISYLGGINNAGDIAGTAKDSSVAPNRAFLDVYGGQLLNLTPDFAGRATDVNDARQVSGYSSSGGFGAFRWDPLEGFQFLGALELAFSFGNAINASGQVVGEALSATGNTSIPFVFTDGVGMEQIPAPVTQHSAATGINRWGDVVGTTQVTGPDLAWLWMPDAGLVDLDDLSDAAVENVDTLEAHDINDAGQILAFGFDNDVPGFRTVLLTPPFPAPPANLSASPGDRIVVLDWDDNAEPDVDGYYVYRSLESGGPYTQVGSELVAESTFSDATVSNGTTYFYVVTAVDTAGNESYDSNEARATPRVPCGLGPELVLLLPPLMWLRRRRST